MRLPQSQPFNATRFDSRHRPRLAWWPAIAATVLLLLAGLGCETETGTPTPTLGETPDGTETPAAGTETPGGDGTPSPANGIGATPTNGIGTPPAGRTATPTGEVTASIQVTPTEVEAGGMGTMEVRATGMPEPGLAGFTIDVEFDPAVMQVESVSTGDEEWAGVTANIANDEGSVRLVGARAQGVPGDSVLAILNVEAAGMAGDTSCVEVTVDRLVDSDLNSIETEQECGELQVL